MAATDDKKIALTHEPHAVCIVQKSVKREPQKVVWMRRKTRPFITPLRERAPGFLYLSCR